MESTPPRLTYEVSRGLEDAWARVDRAIVELQALDKHAKAVSELAGLAIRDLSEQQSLIAEIRRGRSKKAGKAKDKYVNL